MPFYLLLLLGEEEIMERFDLAVGVQLCPAAAAEQHEEEPRQPDGGHYAARDHPAHRYRI